MTDKLPSLEALWEADPADPIGTYDPSVLASLPPVARRFLGHVIEPGTPLYQAVRLTMHGEIKLRTWYPFEAEQVIRIGRGLVWRARAKMAPLVSVKGRDVFIDGVGQMRWKLLGLIPVMTADGPDITRSAAARAQIDTLFVPTALLHESVRWLPEDDDEHAHAMITYSGHQGRVRFRVGGDGRLLDVSMPRWGRPDGEAYREVDFGGHLADERRFGPITVCSRIRCGWWFASDRYAHEGEFFRATIDHMEFR